MGKGCVTVWAVCSGRFWSRKVATGVTAEENEHVWSLETSIAVQFCAFSSLSRISGHSGQPEDHK